MALERFVKEECLKQAVEIAKAYASSGENKHGPIAELLEMVYRRLLQLRREIESENMPLSSVKAEKGEQRQ